MESQQTRYWVRNAWRPLNDLNAGEAQAALQGKFQSSNQSDKQMEKTAKRAENRAFRQGRIERTKGMTEDELAQNKDMVQRAGQAVKGAAKGFADTFTRGAQDIRDAINAKQQASMERAHANRQAEIAENASAETGTYKQMAAQRATRNERTEAAKDAATNAASQARAQTASGAARAMGAGAASLQASTTAAQAADTGASITENRNRADTQAQQAATLAQTQAQQAANAEQMRQQGDEAVYATGLQTRANMEKRKLAEARAAQATQLNSAKVQALQGIAPKTVDEVLAVINGLSDAEKAKIPGLMEYLQQAMGQGGAQ